jgi:ferredoxin-NADP reductase
MLKRALARVNRWALDHVEPRWVDYVASNTMTELNRRLNGFIWTYDLKAQVVKVVDEAPGVKTFVLRPNQHWRGFQPGQHVEVILPIAGERVRRHYSASPLAKGRFSITVKRLHEGRASHWMHQNLHAGMSLRLGAAQGRFCHKGQDKVLYLCAGSGITPCHSMVSALLAQPAGQRPDIQVIAQFRQESDVIFRDALQAWAQAGVKVTTALSSLHQSQNCPAGQSPRLDATQLQRLCPDLLAQDIYLCGPTGFMTEMIEHLRALKVDLSKVHTERFVAPQAATPAPDEFEVEGAQVYFQHLDARITLTAADQGKTLLQVGRDHGLNLEAGCCQGMCGTCKLTVHDGQASGNVLGQAVYLCTSYPASTQLVLAP